MVSVVGYKVGHRGLAPSIGTGDNAYITHYLAQPAFQVYKGRYAVSAGVRKEVLRGIVCREVLCAAFRVAKVPSYRLDGVRRDYPEA